MLVLGKEVFIPPLSIAVMRLSSMALCASRALILFINERQVP